MPTASISLPAICSLLAACFLLAAPAVGQTINGECNNPNMRCNNSYGGSSGWPDTSRIESETNAAYGQAIGNLLGTLGRGLQQHMNSNQGHRSYGSRPDSPAANLIRAKQYQYELKVLQNKLEAKLDRQRGRHVNYAKLNDDVTPCAEFTTTSYGSTMLMNLCNRAILVRWFDHKFCRTGCVNVVKPYGQSTSLKPSHGYCYRAAWAYDLPPACTPD